MNFANGPRNSWKHDLYNFKFKFNENVGVKRRIVTRDTRFLALNRQ